MSNQIITKPWGSETIFSEPDLPYTLKIININEGRRLSLQYHNIKIETLTLISGEVNLTTGPNETELTTATMKRNEGYTIRPNTVHRLEAITNATVIEASTSEAGTTFRLQDDSNRPDETEITRNLPNRGWSKS